MIIPFYKSMKMVTVYILWLGLAISGLAQNYSLPDTALPKKNREDTLSSPPKLKGGALIDTINSKKYKSNSYPADTIPKPPVPKTK